MDTEQILSRLVQIGTVSAVDASTHKARVIFRETGHTSGWLYVLQHYAAGVYTSSSGAHSHEITTTSSDEISASTAPAHSHSGSVTWWMPRINDTVLVLYLPVFNSDGFILGGV